MQTLNPLVSVSVITYNSSKTVEDTLESINRQTYHNIELIISDDCSSDDTVAVCKKWIDVHQDRFVRVDFITAVENTGVAANMNRAMDACRGEWVKDIAGDDVLTDNSIELYVDYIREHPNAICVFANVEVFGGDEKTRHDMEQYYADEEAFFKSTVAEQYDYLTMVGNIIPAPTSFYNREKVVELGIRNDERIPFLEDRPKWINFLKAGVRFDYINMVTAKYRLSDSSLWRKTPEKFSKSQAMVYVYYCFENDFKKGSKKEAMLKWIRSQRRIHDNAFIWRVISKLYRIVFGVS